MSTIQFHYSLVKALEIYDDIYLRSKILNSITHSITYTVFRQVFMFFMRFFYVFYNFFVKSLLVTNLILVVKV